MATLNIGQLITESMMQLDENNSSIDNADQYKAGQGVLKKGSTTFTKGNVDKSDSFIKEMALKAGYVTKKLASDKGYTYPNTKVLQ